MGGDEEANLMHKIKAKERNGLTKLRSQHLTLRAKVVFPSFGFINTNTLTLGDPDELIVLAPLRIKHIKVLTKIGQSNGCFRVKSLFQCLGINHQGLLKEIPAHKNIQQNKARQTEQSQDNNRIGPEVLGP